MPCLLVLVAIILAFTIEVVVLAIGQRKSSR